MVMIFPLGWFLFAVGVGNGTDYTREVELFDLPSVMAIAPGVRKG
jgi:hypothetical protein